MEQDPGYVTLTGAFQPTAVIPSLPGSGWSPIGGALLEPQARPSHWKEWTAVAIGVALMVVLTS